MSTLKSTWGNSLQVVSTTASTAVTVLSAANTAADALVVQAQNWARVTKSTSNAEAVRQQTNGINAVAKAMVLDQLEVERFISTSSRHEELFSQVHAHLVEATKEPVKEA
jgi:oligoendopeptidase F